MIVVSMIVVLFLSFFLSFFFRISFFDIVDLLYVLS